MHKRLSEMTLEELWQLFPIFLTEHKDCWNQWYEEELNQLNTILPSKTVRRISHIGSTAVNTIWAKPIIDILVEIDQDSDMDTIKKILVKNGYICMSEKKQRISFNKGYTANGFAEKVYHIHLRYAGDNEELYFRDYLNENPETAKEYETLKLELWKKYEHNRDGYTESKTQFVEKYTLVAKEKYGTRY